MSVATESNRLLEIRLHMVRNRLTYQKIAAALGCSAVYIYQIVINERKGTGFREQMIERFGFPPELLQYRSLREEQAA